MTSKNAIDNGKRSRHAGTPARALLRLAAATALLGATGGCAGAAEATPTDGAALRAELRLHYPSLAWVERYRRAYPDDVQGSDALWRGAGVPALEAPAALTDALAALQDQHVALAGPAAGAPETLGVLLRSSSDGALAIWRHLDPGVGAVRDGEQVLGIDGQPAARWLAQAAQRTFGGNPRSRMAEAALKLGMATPLDHATVGLGRQVRLRVRGSDGTVRAVELPYRPMAGPDRAALAQVLDRPDLPPLFEAHGYRIGVVRFGAFAPQYDAAFDAAARAADVPGAAADAPMLAGFCAVVRQRLAAADALAAHADALLVDLRGNFGGYARYARLLARALTRAPLPHTYDVFRGAVDGRLKLVEQLEDPSCGTLATARPLIVWVDAGTRSGGEFMAAWLWGAGAIVAGERTIGAGGGRDADAGGFTLPRSNLQVKYSGNFSVFDNGAAVQPGETDEAALLDLVGADGFAPSRARPFAIQAVGLRPDVALPTTAADLADGGLAAARRLVAQLVRRGLLAPPGH